MNEERNGAGIILKWAHLVLILLVQVLMLGAVWGSLYYQVVDHARRLDILEKRQEDNFISRSEYDKRHADLQEAMKELKQEIRDAERKQRLAHG